MISVPEGLYEQVFEDARAQVKYAHRVDCQFYIGAGVCGNDKTYLGLGPLTLCRRVTAKRLAKRFLSAGVTKQWQYHKRVVARKEEE